MDDYTPRRRRIDPEEPRRGSGGGGGGLPIFPLVLAVIFAGLLLGGLIAKFMGNRSPLPAGASPAPSVTPVAVEAPTPTLAPTSTPEPSGKPSPSPEPSASPTPTPTPKPKPKPTATAVAAATATPTARPSVIFITPAPAAKTTPARAESAPTETPAPIAPATTSDRAESVVRSYLNALSRGDEPSAASYLMTGLPNEKFMGPAARITSLNSIKNADGTFKVTADIQTTSGEYFETFNLENGPNGMQISDHYAIKP